MLDLRQGVRPAPTFRQSSIYTRMHRLLKCWSDPLHNTHRRTVIDDGEVGEHSNASAGGFRATAMVSSQADGCRQARNHRAAHRIARGRAYACSTMSRQRVTSVQVK